jgi:membrane-bound lytic murein transglycosylase D
MEEQLPMNPPHRTPTRLAAITAMLLWLAGCATPGGPAGTAQAPATAASAAEAASAPEAAASGAMAAAAQAPGSAASAAADDDDNAAAAAPPIDPLQPDAKVDLNDHQAQMDLWERVRQGFAMPDLDNDLVHAQEQWYASRPDYVARMTDRGGRFLFHIVQQVQKRQMPTELALLPFIESAFNPQAKSVANAAGMWQFIPTTATDFDLKQNVFRDDRRDVLASTDAALDYLDRLHGDLGDWQLALAAYNWGEGNVKRAMAWNERHHLPTDYEHLRMPAETRNYVPKLQAVKNIVLHPEAFGLQLPPLENHPYFLSVPIERDIDVAKAAQLADIDLDEFKLLNPQMNRPVILAAGTPQVLLPYDNANTFVRALQSYHGPLATWTAWVAPRTMRPADVAERFDLSETALREINHIPPRMLIKAGSTLLVPRSGRRAEEDVPEELADNATIALAPDRPPLRRIWVRAGRHGDSVVAVAKRYHVSTATVARWNRCSTHARFKAGALVAVYVPQQLSHPAASKAVVAHSSGSHARRTAGAKHGTPHRTVARAAGSSHHVASGKRAPAKHVAATKGGSAGKLSVAQD